jgi:hypothetical protein
MASTGLIARTLRSPEGTIATNSDLLPRDLAARPGEHVQSKRPKPITSRASTMGISW